MTRHFSGFPDQVEFTFQVDQVEIIFSNRFFFIYTETFFLY